ncbi:MAG: hypothetical protein ACM3XO_24270 [Bacteroidota bacterium]
MTAPSLDRAEEQNRAEVSNGSPNTSPAHVITEMSVSANSRLLMGFKDASSLRHKQIISALIYDR